MELNPTPWHANTPAVDEYAENSIIRDANGDVVAISVQKNIAQAQLLAAAWLIPEMRELLSQAYDRFTDNEMHPANDALRVWKEKVVAILEKSEGGQI